MALRSTGGVRVRVGNDLDPTVDQRLCLCRERQTESVTDEAVFLHQSASIEASVPRPPRVSEIGPPPRHRPVLRGPAKGDGARTNLA